jgi:hypothetical protein
VDESNKQTQCIGVRNSYIIDTGTLREFSCQSLCYDLQFSVTLVTDDVKLRWNKAALVDQESGTTQGLHRSPVSIRFIDRGAIVVPGLSGESQI